MAAVGVGAFLVAGKQVDEQRGQPSLLELGGDKAVAGAVPAAAAAVREQDDPPDSAGSVRLPSRLREPAEMWTRYSRTLLVAVGSMSPSLRVGIAVGDATRTPADPNVPAAQRMPGAFGP
jgi:hypothetical protein